MKNKGFTLIELIAVVVMMGMILLIVFPATSRLLKSNEEKKFDSYYDSVQEALERYARTRRDELGGINGNGCVDDKKLSELKDYDYISEYTDEENVTCLSPSDFTSERLQALEIDTSKQYVNIRLENNKGKVKVKYSMICVKNYDDPNTMSLMYSNLIERNSSCDTYVPVVTNSLINDIKDKYTTTTVGSTKYLEGNPSDNYVLYSGKMWRIISFDSLDKTIKLVTDDSVAVVNYNNMIYESTKTNEYSTSNIYYWLQNKFLPTLRNPEKYLLDVEWNYSATNSSVANPITGGKTIISKVGMINVYEYIKASNYLNKAKNFWLINTTLDNGETPNYAWYVNNSGAVTSSDVSNYYGVRPSIVLKSNVKYINGGVGTKANPYKLIGDTSANIGSPLNSRYPGEYVTINDTLFRISLVDSKYTKLIATETIPIDSTKAASIQYITSSYYNSVAGTIGFHFNDTVYSDNTYIGSYLKLWASPIDDILIEGDFCRMTVTKTTSQATTCSSELVINTKQAIPKIGDMFAINSTNEYWTINNSEEERINVISPNCSVRDISVDDLSAILPVIVINNEALITGGNGTESNPYTIE